ncbi:hypothetical protein OROMI_018892 [Orobanche minor]
MPQMIKLLLRVDDKVVVESAEATLRHNVAINCAIITQVRTARFSENQFSAKMCRLVPGWAKPICIGRHAFGDEYRATDTVIKGAEKLKLQLPEGTGESTEFEVFNFTGAGGVALSMYKTAESIRAFAEASMNTAYQKKWPLYLSTKNTILKRYDGISILNEDSKTYSKKFMNQIGNLGMRKQEYGEYEHHLIDDMVAYALKNEGGYVWACKNYDGDVHSDFLAQGVENKPPKSLGFGSLGLLASVLVCPDGKTIEVDSAHGTVTRHYRVHQEGGETSTNSITSIFAWTRGLAHRAKLDAACIGVVESGKMTKDLALIIHGSKLTRDHYLNTEEFIDAVADDLKARLFP